MGKTTGFMEYEREETNHRSVCERIKDYNPYLLPCTKEHIETQSARCMDCGVPFCHAGMPIKGGLIGCPLGNLIPEINDLMYRGEWEEAFLRLSLTHPFPEITGRVCPAPCEGSCTEGEYGQAVTIKDIERTAAAYGWEKNIENKEKVLPTGKKVAIVGSGPAGLAAAHTLSTFGHQVTVFERADAPGGFLLYGIPNMKLEKEVLQERIRRLELQGIKFKVNTEVGKEYPLEKLIDDFDAVILAIGARVERKLEAKGSEGKGLYTAIPYLKASTEEVLGKEKVPLSESAKDKEVIVVGGGDTGTDCIATAIRQGAKNITALEIMPEAPLNRSEKDPWPLWPKLKKIDYGHEEAIEVFGHDVREYETTIKEILLENDQVVGAKTVKVSWEKDQSGRYIPVELPETEKIRKADLIITAMGFTGVEREIIEQLHLKTTPINTIEATEGDSTGKGGYKTSFPGIFVAGDARRGPSLVVWAIREGIEVGNECNRYLEK